MTNRSSRLRPITHVTATAFFVLVIFLLIYVFVYNGAQRTMKDNAISHVSSLLEQGAREVNDAVSNLINQTTNLKYNETLVALKEVETLGNADFAKLIDLKKLLQSVKPDREMLNGVISRMFLLFDGESPFICAADGGIYHNLPRAVQSLSIGAQGESAEEFLAILRGNVSTQYVRRLTHAFYAYNDGEVYLSCFYIQPLSNVPDDVYVVLQLNVEKMFEMAINGNQVGEPAGLVSRNRVLYEYLPLPEGEENLFYNDELKTTFISKRIDFLGTTIYLSVSDDSIVSQISGFTKFLKLLLYVILIMLLVLVALFSVYLAFPMQKLTRRLQYYGHTSFYQFENEYQRISENLVMLKPALRTALMDKLLRSEYLTPAERTALKSVSQFHAESRIRVAVVSDTGPEAMDEGHISKCETLLKQYFGDAMVYSVDPGVFAVLHICEDSEESMQALSEELEQVLTALEECIKDRKFAVGVSESAKGLDYIHTAFNDAYNELRELRAWNLSGVRFTEKRNGYEVYGISMEDIDHLNRLIMAGSEEDACAYYDAIAKKEFGEELTLYREREVCRQFFYDIRGILMRLSGQYDLSAIRATLSEYPDALPFTHVLSLLRNAVHYAVSSIGGRKEDSENDLAQSIKIYLQENYANPALSLTALADLFDMSESMMSRFFKAHMGVTYSAYLENIRLTEAETLLSSSTLPVKDVAEMVGYANTTTFYKAFRRKWGVSPTTHREIDAGG
ncbi:MAG: helix-turn-helix domain-containing protein [Clostridia bacterium]|nr:helix-turn-helix domain-containing protein [Clostridia bacterium]